MAGSLGEEGGARAERGGTVVSYWFLVVGAEKEEEECWHACGKNAGAVPVETAGMQTAQMHSVFRFATGMLLQHGSHKPPWRTETRLTQAIEHFGQVKPAFRRRSVQH